MGVVYCETYKKMSSGISNDDNQYMYHYLPTDIIEFVMCLVKAFSLLFTHFFVKE